MKCPNCEQLLQISERQNIEIDYCPSCRGVWLDRGELDKIIEFSNQQISQSSNQQSRDRDERDGKQRGYQDGQYKEDKYRNNQEYPNKHHKKKGLLGDLFDFG